MEDINLGLDILMMMPNDGFDVLHAALGGFALEFSTIFNRTFKLSISVMMSLPRHNH